jgi:hypothetical protein
MEESLFSKHILQIKKQKNKKEEVINFIKEKTGIFLQSEDITITKKNITFSTSSVVKQKLHQKNIQTILLEHGYTSKIL